MKKKRTNLFLGLIFIALGVLALLWSLSIINFKIFFKGWWTLFIIIPCIIDMLEDRIKLSNILFLILGILLFLSSNNLIKFSLIFKFILPLFLIIIGIKFIFNLNYNSNTIIFSNKKLDLELKSNDIKVLFSNIIVNLEKVNKKEIYLDINSYFSEVILYIPKDTNVVVEGSSLFSAIIDHRDNKNTDDYKCTLYLKMNSICGDVTLKEVK